jgi:two-component system, OmpR family, KDP operon response regulator KdpE
MSARILLIDDEPQIRKFLRLSLIAHGFEVREAATATAGLTELATRGAELVVLDLGLPDRDGIDALRELREWSRVPLMVLSVRASEAEKVRALDLGANDYLTKPFGIEEFMARVRNLLRLQRVDSADGRFHDERLDIDLAQRRVLVNGAELALSRKEFAVLAALVRHPGQLLTQTQLLREIWGPTHTEDTHYLRIVIGKLRHKLGDDATRPRYLRTEPGVGYRFMGR